MSDKSQLIKALLPVTSRVRTSATAIKKPDGSTVWTQEALTDPLLAKHLNGGPARGCSPIREGESAVMLALFDLDSHGGETPWSDMVIVAEKLDDALRERGLRPIPFRSTGGRGIHLLLIWDTPQDAYSVRRVMSDALLAMGYRNGTGGVVAKQIEIFPKQDTVAPGKFGNMFILPLAGKSEPLEPLMGWAPMGKDYAVGMQWPVSDPVPQLERPAPPERKTASNDHKHLTDVLSYVSPDVGNEEWFKIICGIHHETEGSTDGLAVATAFSAGDLYALGEKVSSKFEGPEEVEALWDRLGRRGESESEATIHTIERFARENGWQDNVLDDFDDLTAAEAVPSTLRFRFEPAHEFAAKPIPQWIVDGLIPKAELAVVYGASAAGKSFLALDLIAAIARGIPWRDMEVTKGRVAYVVAEGGGGFRKRLTAYAQQHNISLRDVPISILDNAPNLMDVKDAKDVVLGLQAVGGADVVVVDTLAQTLHGGNENSGEDVGRYLTNLKGIHRATGALVIVIHHSGKDDSKGARGWSGLRAAADVELEVVRDDDRRALRVTKQKDGEDGLEFGFRLNPIVVGVDQKGREIVSCVVEHNDKAPEKRRTKPLGGVQKIADKVFFDAVGLDGGVSESDWFEAIAGQLGGDNKNFRISRAVDKLVADGLYVKNDGKYRRMSAA